MAGGRALFGGPGPLRSHADKAAGQKALCFLFNT
jgi:hypothetical protein